MTLSLGFLDFFFFGCKSENVPFMSSCFYIYRLKLYALSVNGKKMRLPFIDSDLSYRGALQDKVDYIYMYM